MISKLGNMQTFTDNANIMFYADFKSEYLEVGPISGEYHGLSRLGQADCGEVAVKHLNAAKWSNGGRDRSKDNADALNSAPLPSSRSNDLPRRCHHRCS